MNTPICDFVSKYSEDNTLRLHMPGHKGISLVGCEHLDITEIKGADSLYEASGIIRESEENASELFACSTYYSTEGSSQCIRAMLRLAMLYAHKQGKSPLILAARNAHKTFLSAAALLDFELCWIFPEEQESYLSCNISPSQLEGELENMDTKPAAVYITSPDYLGNVADIKGLARVCHRHSVLLLVDNAHGAYLRFLTPSRHPMDLGADMCCDSAHKTLPALTGGAYLHTSDSMGVSRDDVKSALSLFGSTSPSYLILRSLDKVNAYLAHGYSEKLMSFADNLFELKEKLTAHGYRLCGDEVLKLTLCTKPYGYLGDDFAEILRRHNIECEFSDPDFVVMMFTPEIPHPELARLQSVLLSIPRLSPIPHTPPAFSPAKRAMSVRKAMLSPCETLPVSLCIGRVLSQPGVSCPPAVPIVVSGEVITEEAVRAFGYYGIHSCQVTTE